MEPHLSLNSSTPSDIAKMPIEQVYVAVDSRPLGLISTLVYVKSFQTLFEHDAVSPLWWLLISWYAPTIFLLEEGRKAVARRREAFRAVSAPRGILAQTVPIKMAPRPQNS